MSRIVIFDLDGTLADCSHRIHLIEGSNKDYDAFYKASENDTLIESVANIFYALKDQGYKMWVFTGRSDSVESDTVSWLLWNTLDFDKLVMRKNGDYRKDYEIKREWLNRFLPTPESRNELLGVFEDRKSVVNMWRSEGVACFQVNEGDF